MRAAGGLGSLAVTEWLRELGFVAQQATIEAWIAEDRADAEPEPTGTDGSDPENNSRNTTTYAS